jgi:hypothetical protein
MAVLSSFTLLSITDTGMNGMNVGLVAFYDAIDEVNALIKK